MTQLDSLQLSLLLFYMIAVLKNTLNHPLLLFQLIIAIQSRFLLDTPMTPLQVITSQFQYQLMKI